MDFVEWRISKLVRIPDSCVYDTTYYCKLHAHKVSFCTSIISRLHWQYKNHSDRSGIVQRAQCERILAVPFRCGMEKFAIPERSES